MGKKSNKPAEEDTILVIRLSAMGDVAMAVPVLLALNNKYPTLRFTVLSKAFLAPLFEHLPHVDFKAAEIKGKHSGPSGLYKLFLELKTQDFIAIADLHGVIRSHVISGFFRAVGLKVGKINKGRREKKTLTRSKNKIFKPTKTTHQRYAEVFENLGYPVELNGTEFLKKRQITAKMSQKLAISGQKRIGFAPFAAHEGKKYPLHLVTEVLSALAEKKDCIIFLFGGGKEEEHQLNTLAEKFKNTTNIAGRFSFSEELDLISNLDLMISMDSGNGHLAAVYGVPVITVWGVTHPYLGFAPYAQPEENQIVADRERFPLIPTSVYGNKTPAGYEKAMESITPQKIVDQVNKLIK